MAIVNHNQSLSIYRMVLDRLPFVVDDSLLIFDLSITAVNTTTRKLTIANNMTDIFWIGQQNLVVEPNKILTVRSWAYNSGITSTEIEYTSLASGDANVGNTLHVEANWNEQLISRYIYQYMVQMQPCFQISDADFGDESKYSDRQKMIIADLVAWAILFRQSVINGNGDSMNSGAVAPPTKYISSTKSGEVSVNWSYIKINETGAATLKTENMMKAFKENAICLAQAIGCSIEICEDGSVNCSCSSNSSPIIEYPFRVAPPLYRCKR